MTKKSIETCKDFIKKKNKQFTEDRDNGELLKFKDIGEVKEGEKKRYYYFKREEWTFMQQHNIDEKAFVVERLKFDHADQEVTHKLTHGEIQYRFGYFIVGKKGNKKDKWTWGQFCPIIPEKDFEKLIKQAKKDGVIR